MTKSEAKPAAKKKTTKLPAQINLATAAAESKQAVNLVVLDLRKSAVFTDFFLIAINKGLWQGFSKDEKGMIAQALKTAMDWQWREQPGEIEKSLAKLKTLMQVNELSPAERAAFVDATRPVYAQFEASVGKEFLDFTRQQLGSA